MTQRVWFVASIFVFTICLIVPQGASAQLCNAEAHEWVDAHKSEIPRTLDGLSRFPLNYRRAIYSALTPEERSRLWQEQFERILERDDLTDNQRDVVLEAIQLATPDLFSSLKNRHNPARLQDRERVAAFEKKAREVFGKTGAGDLFARIGPADVEYGVIRPRGTAPIEKGLEKAAGCSCSDSSDYCSSAFNCQSGGCTLIRDECGTLWTYDCDGQCQSNATVSVDVKGIDQPKN
jgi:hypothetical protein